MKKMILGVFALSMIFGTAQAAQKFTCTGVYENKGAELTLTLGKNQFSLHGTAMNGDDFGDDGFKSPMTCQGRGSEVRGAYMIMEVTDNPACSADYVKVMQSLAKEGSGMLVLGKRSGGDTHDSSGYIYRYYHCDRE